MNKDMLDDIKRHIEYTNTMEQKSIRDIQMQEMYFEIERLKNKNKELLTLYTGERAVKGYYKHIIYVLEKWLEERLEKLDIVGYDDDVFNGLELTLDKLQELKGDD